ncbi:MAG: adenine deaminase [Verrucomicrobiota bacterium]
MDESIIAAAHGEKPADLLLRNAQLINVLSGEIHPADVAVAGGRVVGFGSYEARETVDLKGQYLSPGFLDAHVHMESSMVTAPEFARAVVPRGTTTVITDPHEIANVHGLEGVRYMLETSEGLPLRVYLMLPSCVPSTDMETSGARLSASDFNLLINHPRVLGLAEVMNFPGVLRRSPEVLRKIAAAGARPVDGHAPGLSGKDLAAYIAAGVGSDHECTTAEEAREKLRMGMHIVIREGSTAHNLDALLPAVTLKNAARCSFCTDDRHPADLIAEGHINYLVKRSIQKGLDPVVAVQMATINTVRYFGLKGLGAVAPGCHADLVVIDNLVDFNIRQVYCAGRKVAEDGRYLVKAVERPRADLRSSVNVAWMDLNFDVPVPAGRSKPRVRVIGVLPGQIGTRSLVEAAAVKDGLAVSDPGRDLLKIAVVERHLASGSRSVGFIRGFGLKRGAMASSVSHDSHNIVVVGASDADMTTAVVEVARLRGGQVVVADNKVLACVPLPIGGLMSDLPLEDVRDRIEEMTAAAAGLGCTLPHPLMTLSFMALPVIPELKLTDKGLVDVAQFRIVPLFAD